MNGLDDIFNEDELELGAPTGEESNEILSNTSDIFEDVLETPPANVESNSILEDYLKLKGITDGKVTILDENNQEQLVNFSDLTKEEQLDILSASDQEIDYGLEDDEIEIINYLRGNNLSFADYLEQYKKEVIQELQGNSEPTYEIDNYDDQELFVLDLKLKYELSEEELLSELQKELQNEDLFKKKVDKLRADYKALEEESNKQKQEEFDRQRDEQYNQFSEAMKSTANKNSELYGFDLEEQDKSQVLSFILDLDADGASNFYKSLNDPQKLYEAAWFLKFGKSAFDTLNNAYQTEIKSLKAKIGPEKPPVVVNRRGSKPNSIYDLQ